MPDELERHIQQSCAEQGIELTPDEISEGLAEAHQRIRPGPDGCCIRCGHDGSDGRDFRYGLCDVCAFCKNPDCLEFADYPGDGWCDLHRPKAEEQADG